MPKVKVLCSWCGAVVHRYPSCINAHTFCSTMCRSHFLSKTTNPSGYIQHTHLADYNREHNKHRMTVAVKSKLRRARRAKGDRRSYPKLYGRHLHRQIAEIKIGRSLRPGEVVHHIDGDIQNYSPDNLYVCRDQKEHARIHMRQRLARKRGDAV